MMFEFNDYGAKREKHNHRKRGNSDSYPSAVPYDPQPPAKGQSICREYLVRLFCRRRNTTTMHPRFLIFSPGSPANGRVRITGSQQVMAGKKWPETAGAHRAIREWLLAGPRYTMDGRY
jgi:hypothetical protein